jgi:RNA polymerase sigma factor (sigma-70 family)
MSVEIRKKLGRIFDEEKDRLLSFIRQRVNRIEDAEDILQDVFFLALNGYSVTSPIENLAGWLYVSAKNRIIDLYRRRSRNPVGSEADKATLESLIAGAGFNPEKQLFRNAISEALSEAIETLPARQQQIVVWQMIEGRSFREISEHTGEPLGTLLSRKRNAVRTLRKHLHDLKEILDEIE